MFGDVKIRTEEETPLALVTAVKLRPLAASSRAPQGPAPALQTRLSRLGACGRPGWTRTAPGQAEMVSQFWAKP